MENLIKEFQELKTKKEEIVKKISEDAKVLFHKMCKSIFEKSNNKIASFTFTAYTPYFNDGEECKYTSYLEYADFVVLDDNCNEVTLEGYWNGYESQLEENSDKIDKNKQDILNGIEEFDNIYKIFSDEDIQLIFGDHVEVKCSKDQILVYGYDHD